MPPDFLSGFFKSDPAGEQYGIASKLFNGAAWVPSPLTDPKPGANGIRAWWTGKFDGLTTLLDDTPDMKNFVDQARSNSVDRIQKMLDRLYDQANHPSTIEKKDTVAALMAAFKDLQTDLKPVIRAQQDKSKAAPALGDLMNASLTTTMSAVVTLENDERGKLSFAKTDFQATFNELFLRDRAMTLSKMVGGDLPADMCYGAQDTPDGYMKQATANLTQGAADLQGLAATVSNLEGALGTPKQLSNEKEAVVGLAINAQKLGQQTQRLAAAALVSRGIKASNDAASAAALSGVVVESMRGVLGVAPNPNGPGKLTSALDEGKLMQFGKATADKIGKEAARERDADPLYPRYDPAR